MLYFSLSGKSKIYSSKSSEVLRTALSASSVKARLNRRLDYKSGSLHKPTILGSSELFFSYMEASGYTISERDRSPSARKPLTKPLLFLGKISLTFLRPSKSPELSESPEPTELAEPSDIRSYLRFFKTKRRFSHRYFQP